MRLEAMRPRQDVDRGAVAADRDEAGRLRHHDALQAEGAGEAAGGEAGVVGGEKEGAAGGDFDGFKEAVAVEEAFLERGDARGVGGAELAVEHDFGVGDDGHGEGGSLKDEGENEEKAEGSGGGECLVHGAAFIEGFLVFGVGGGVPYNAAADGIVGAFAGAGEGADGDVEVAVAVEAEPADGAGVDVAAVRFQLVDDLHGADLGGAGDGAAGKGGAEAVDDVAIGAEDAGDVGDEVVDGGVGFEAPEVVDADGAVFADAAEVVSLEPRSSGVPQAWTRPMRVALISSASAGSPTMPRYQAAMMLVAVAFNDGSASASAR